MKFIAKYLCVIAVTLYCGIIGFVGGTMVSAFLANSISHNTSLVITADIFDILRWVGGAIFGGLPLGYIGANWIGAKFGWLSAMPPTRRDNI